MILSCNAHIDTTMLSAPLKNKYSNDIMAGNYSHIAEVEMRKSYDKVSDWIYPVNHICHIKTVQSNEHMENYMMQTKKQKGWENVGTVGKKKQSTLE